MSDRELVPAGGVRLAGALLDARLDAADQSARPPPLGQSPGGRGVLAGVQIAVDHHEREQGQACLDVIRTALAQAVLEEPGSLAAETVELYSVLERPVIRYPANGHVPLVPMEPRRRRALSRPDAGPPGAQGVPAKPRPCRPRSSRSGMPGADGGVMPAVGGVARRGGRPEAPQVVAAGTWGPSGGTLTRRPGMPTARLGSGAGPVAACAARRSGRTPGGCPAWGGFRGRCGASGGGPVPCRQSRRGPCRTR